MRYTWPRWRHGGSAAALALASALASALAGALALPVVLGMVRCYRALVVGWMGR